MAKKTILEHLEREQDMATLDFWEAKQVLAEAERNYRYTAEMMMRTKAEYLRAKLKCRIKG